MLIQVSNMPLSLDAALPGNERLRDREIARALGVKPSAVRSARLTKRSVDARKKANVHFVASFAVELDDEALGGAASGEAASGATASGATTLGKTAVLRPARGVNVSEFKPLVPLAAPDCAAAFAASGEPRPVVVGAGPAGLFCALHLARAGLRPLLVERGSCVEKRVLAVQAFNEGGALNESCNIQFGEGGAGTFSDGKLNTGTKSPHIRHVLEEFVAAGAPAEILWQAKPHIGTDKLVDVVRNLREAIVAAGGEVRFDTLMERVELVGDAAEARLAAVVLRNVETNEVERIAASRVVLACGHSARDTFAMIRAAGFPMQRKPFAVGVRIEHPQDLINRAQYGKAAGHPALGAADYKLAVHTKDGRGVYTFCMCPGGEVVAAASEEGGVCVNGMSRFARDGANANSALLVGVEPDDFPGDDVLAGVEFQRELERAAFKLGARGLARAGAGTHAAEASHAGGQARPDASEHGAALDNGQSAGAPRPYTAPAQTVGDFLAGRSGSSSSLVAPTYPRGVSWVDLHECLPKFVTDALEEGLVLLDRKLTGFAHPQAVMTGVEARSSSPVRILRDDSLQAGETGLYPCGEGAGYAGGITSAAVDGLRVAEAIIFDFS